MKKVDCMHEYVSFYGDYLCKKCRVVDNLMCGGTYEKTEREMERDCKHIKHIEELRERVHDLPNIPRKLGAKKGSGIEHVSWDVRSHYTFLPPKERRGKVLESYKFSLPLELREEFQKEFEKDDKGKCAKKKKMIIAKYKVACRHSLGFDLDEEVRKLGGKVRISARDLE